MIADALSFGPAPACPAIAPTVILPLYSAQMLRKTTPEAGRRGAALRIVPTERDDMEAAGPPRRLVVVGFGMVAFKLVERLSSLGALERYDVTLIGDEPYPAYNRIHLTEWLDHGDFSHLALGQPGWSETPGIRTLIGDAVTAIDRESRTVRTAGGRRIDYDRLVLATGSVAFRPPIEGADHDGVFVYRTLNDLKRIRERSETVHDAVIVGGGLLGIETAEALHRKGLAVTLVESGPYLMKRQLDPQTAAQLEQKLAEHGISALKDTRAPTSNSMMLWAASSSAFR